MRPLPRIIAHFSIHRDKVFIVAAALLLGRLVFAATASATPQIGDVACLPPGAHDAKGVATIIDDRTIHVTNFTYDGTAPLVYFYLGTTDTYEAFLQGTPIGPPLGKFLDESVTVQLPEGESLSAIGAGAISVWCAAANVNFTSAPLGPPKTQDSDGDGDVDLKDFSVFQRCFGPVLLDECGPHDISGTGSIGLPHHRSFQSCLVGPGQVASCNGCFIFGN